jgi:DNA-binding Lrp family transcriptional regulator
MPSAFVLINCKLGSEERVIYELKLLHEVVEANRISGIYDVVVKVKADTLEELKETIDWKIRTIRGIKSTLTFIEIQERQGNSTASANDNIYSEKGKKLLVDSKKTLAAGAS